MIEEKRRREKKGVAHCDCPTPGSGKKRGQITDVKWLKK